MATFLKQVLDYYLWVIILILGINLYQGRVGNPPRKRISTLIVAALALVFELVLVFVVDKELSPWFALVGLLAVVGVGALLRRYTWPYRMHCTRCKKRLSFGEILKYDENLCTDCYGELHNSKAHGRNLSKGDVHEEDMNEKAVEQTHGQKRELWDEWEPQAICTTCYILDKNDNVLLIERLGDGFGKGKVTAPGGHVEPEETADQCVVREVKEEVGLEILDFERIGVLNFAIPDNNLKVHVYIARDFEGTPVETNEARPFWAPVKALPFERMFDDDKLWLPAALESKHFEFYASCDREGNMIDHQYHQYDDPVLDNK